MELDVQEKEKKKNRRKNPYGEGSIYKCETGRFKGKWIGKLIIGKNPDTGNPIRRSFYGTSWQEVRDKMKLAKAELDKGIDLQKQNTLTFGQWMKNWMNNYKKIQLEITTWENYYRSINTHIYPVLGTFTLKELTTDHIQQFYTNLIGQGKAPATVRRNHQIIHSCLNQAVKNHLISHNPSDGIILPKLENKEARAMTMNEMDNFLSLLLIDKIDQTTIGPKWRAAFLTTLGTGLREGEVLALTWDAIDLRNKTLTVSQSLARTKSRGQFIKSPKSKKSKRKIPLPDDVAIALRLHRILQNKHKRAVASFYTDQNLVFCTTKGTPIGLRNFSRKFAKLREKANLSKEITLHSLRHTYATRLLEQGESLKTVQELLGHEDISTTGNTYAHVMPEIKKQAAKNLDRLLTRKKASQLRETFA